MIFGLLAVSTHEDSERANDDDAMSAREKTHGGGIRGTFSGAPGHVATSVFTPIVTRPSTPHTPAPSGGPPHADRGPTITASKLTPFVKKKKRSTVSLTSDPIHVCGHIWAEINQNT